MIINIRNLCLAGAVVNVVDSGRNSKVPKIWQVKDPTILLIPAKVVV